MSYAYELENNTRTFTSLDPFDWFNHVTGVSEYEFINNKHEHLLLQNVDEFGPNFNIKNTKTGEIWPAGSFNTFSIKKLNKMIGFTEEKLKEEKLKEEKKEKELEDKELEDKQEFVFEVHTRSSSAFNLRQFVEVSALQANAKDGTMFQVASNFNCCENASYRDQLDNGEFVTGLMVDCTQGPGAASGAAVSTITRTHAVFYDFENPKNNDIGQCMKKQINLLDDESLKIHFPVVCGKVLVNPPTQSWVNQKHLLSKIKIGLHCNVRANFCRSVPKNPDIDCSIVNPAPQIDQVFTSTINIHSYGLQNIGKDEIYSRMNFLLLGAYCGTFASAVLRKSSVLYLTCIGGGQFGNPLENIALAIAKALYLYKPMLKHLKRIILPLYPVKSKGKVFIDACKQYNIKVLEINH